jgi:hypothetical protein
MKNEIDYYKEAVDKSRADNALHAFDDPYIPTSNNSDAYRLIQWFGSRVTGLHKSAGYTWFVKTDREWFKVFVPRELSGIKKIASNSIH